MALQRDIWEKPGEYNLHIPAKVPRPATIVKNHIQGSFIFCRRLLFLSALNMILHLRIIPQNKSVQLFEEYGIIAVSQLSDCNERQLKVMSDSIPTLSLLIEKLLADTHMDKNVD